MSSNPEHYKNSITYVPAEDIEEWDSLNHITLIISIEKEFNFKLNLADVEKLEDIGGMIELLFEKVNS